MEHGILLRRCLAGCLVCSIVIKEYISGNFSETIDPFVPFRFISVRNLRESSANTEREIRSCKENLKI